MEAKCQISSISARRHAGQRPSRPPRGGRFASRPAGPGAALSALKHHSQKA